MRADYIVYQGEPLVLSLLAVEGYIDNVVSVEALLKAAGPNGSVPSKTAPVIATFETSETEAPDVGWDFILSETITDTLKPGFYMTNAQLNLDSGGPVKTDHVTIEIRGSVS